VRYFPVQSSVLVGWNGPGGFEFTEGLILNLSLGGIAVAASGLPRGISAVWIIRSGAHVDRSEWIRVDVKEISSAPDMEQTLRLKFTGSCPYELFKTVVFSARAGDGAGAPSCPETSGMPPARDPAASGSRPADRLADSSPTIQQTESAPAPGSTTIPPNHLRTAFAMRWKVRGESVGRGRS
jgi:hypothetical protein